MGRKNLHVLCVDVMICFVFSDSRDKVHMHTNSHVSKAHPTITRFILQLTVLTATLVSNDTLSVCSVTVGEMPLVLLDVDTQSASRSLYYVTRRTCRPA